VDVIAHNVAAPLRRAHLTRRPTRAFVASPKLGISPKRTCSVRLIIRVIVAVRGSPMTQGNLRYGDTTNNERPDRTVLSGTVANEPAFTVRNGPATIPTTSGEGDGILGISETGSGIRGRGPEAVTGEGLSIGVIGDTAAGTGVYGYGGAGVVGEGENFGTYGDTFDGIGVYGGSANGNGVLGHSSTTVGVRGEGATGVEGEGREIGVFGRSGANGWAGVFFDGLFVRGDSTVQGSLLVTKDFLVLGANKHMVMPHPDGTDRLLYCLEGAEAWLEDFGTAQLSAGRARVDLEDDYAALVETDEYHIFLSPEGDSNGLYVAAKDSRGFEVREQQGGSSTPSFSYRIAARPKGGRRERLAIMELPKQLEVRAPTPPPPAALEEPPRPTAPRRSRHTRDPELND